MRALWSCLLLMVGCSPEPRPQGTYTLHQQPATSCAYQLPETATLVVSDWLPDVQLDGVPGVDVLVAEVTGHDNDPNMHFVVEQRIALDSMTMAWVRMQYGMWGDSDHLDGFADYTAPIDATPCRHTVESTAVVPP